jgi:ferritin
LPLAARQRAQAATRESLAFGLAHRCLDGRPVDGELPPLAPGRHVLEVDGQALTPASPQPPQTFDTVRTLLEQVYAHEQKVTASIHELISLSYEDKDHTTLNFLQWYVQEQREEEALMRNILDRIKLIGEGPMCLYYIDKELEKINKAQIAAEASVPEA